MNRDDAVTRDPDSAERCPVSSRFKWVIGTPYFVQGTSNLADVPILYFIKFTLGMGDAGGQLFESLRNAGWFVKPLWGHISDRIPLAGYHRKSWFVLMACLALVFWFLSALLAFLDVRLPLAYLVLFNLAFSAYAFVDVVCDALMVEHGRREGRVSGFINFQWTVLAAANAGSVLLGSWLQRQVEAGSLPIWTVFVVTGLPPLATAIIGLRYIREEKVTPSGGEQRESFTVDTLVKAGKWLVGAVRCIPSAPARLNAFRRRNRVLWLLVLFIFFWKFSPSIGYIERSYLIDMRGFRPLTFGTVLSIGSLTFLASIVTYRWVVRHVQGVAWHQYLYAMIAIGIAAFPLSFFLYLDPDHVWWQWLAFGLPLSLDPLPGWNRYQWFYLVVQVVLGFATIPAFIIPLTITGQVVDLQHAGLSYAFIMSLSNVTNAFEGVVGAGLYQLLSQPWLAWLLTAFESSLLNIADATDERTLILQIFVYIGLLFTLLTIPFVIALRRELERREIRISLVDKTSAGAD